MRLPTPTPLIALLALALHAAGAQAAVPLTLAEALQAAGARDERIGQAAEDLEAARADTAGQVSDLLPDTTLSARRVNSGNELQWLSRSVGYPVSDTDYSQLDVGVDVPLVDPGAIADVVVAGRSQRAAVHTHEGTRYAVLYEVVRAYYEALSAHQTIEVARASAEAARTLEAAAESRLAAGTETRIGVERARADRIAAEGDVEQAGFAAQAADLTLSLTAHLPAERYALVVPDAPTLPGADTDARVALARADRPDLEALRWSEKAAESSVHAEGLALAPELKLAWSWRYRDYDREDFDLPPESWSLGLMASWQLPGAIGPAADIRAARASARRATLERQRLEREAGTWVRSAEVTLAATAAALAVAEQTDALAQSNLDAGLRLYQEGLASGLEVTTLKTERDAAAAELMQARLDNALAEVDLLESLGADPRQVYGDASR